MGPAGAQRGAHSLPFYSATDWAALSMKAASSRSFFESPPAGPTSCVVSVTSTFQKVHVTKIAIIGPSPSSTFQAEAAIRAAAVLRKARDKWM